MQICHRVSGDRRPARGVASRPRDKKNRTVAGGRLILPQNEKIRKIAEKYKDAIHALYLGRGYLFPVALEGALKLKEISYIHA